MEFFTGFITLVGFTVFLVGTAAVTISSAVLLLLNGGFSSTTRMTGIVVLAGIGLVSIALLRSVVG